MELKNKQFEKILQIQFEFKKRKQKISNSIFLKINFFTLSLPKFKNLKENQRKVIENPS